MPGTEKLEHITQNHLQCLQTLELTDLCWDAPYQRASDHPIIDLQISTTPTWHTYSGTFRHFSTYTKTTYKLTKLLRRPNSGGMLPLSLVT